MRKSELAGLLWSDVDFVQGRLVVSRQLLRGGSQPCATLLLSDEVAPHVVRDRLGHREN